MTLQAVVVTGASQARWMCLDRSEGSVVLARQLHEVLMLDTAAEADRMASWRGSVAAAEARKAEGTRMHALLTPSRPPPM